MKRRTVEEAAHEEEEEEEEDQHQIKDEDAETIAAVAAAVNAANKKAAETKDTDPSGKVKPKQTRAVANAAHSTTVTISPSVVQVVRVLLETERFAQLVRLTEVSKRFVAEVVVVQRTELSLYYL